MKRIQSAARISDWLAFGVMKPDTATIIQKPGSAPNSGFEPPYRFRMDCLFFEKWGIRLTDKGAGIVAAMHRAGARELVAPSLILRYQAFVSENARY
jgi:hypothetical protein